MEHPFRIKVRDELLIPLKSRQRIRGQSFLLLFLEIYLKQDRSVSGGMNCQISGTGKYPAGLSSVVRNMFIPVVRRILIQRVPAGRALIHKMRSCLASKGIAKVARSLNFILLLKLIFIQIFLQRKTLHRTKKQNTLVLSFIRNSISFQTAKLWIDNYFLYYKSS